LAFGSKEKKLAIVIICHDLTQRCVVITQHCEGSGKFDDCQTLNALFLLFVFLCVKLCRFCIHLLMEIFNLANGSLVMHAL
jgi:hypothetical protein